MEFAVSDGVVHPSHGTGRITGVENFNLIEGFERYYVIEMTDNSLTLRVPIRKISELGIRPVMSEAKLNRVMDILRGSPNRLPEEYKARQAEVRAKLKTGEAIQVAETVRDLTWHRELDHLTKADNDLLARGREMLAGEMAMVIGTEASEADRLINSLLSGSMEARAKLGAA